MTDRRKQKSQLESDYAMFFGAYAPAPKTQNRDPENLEQPPVLRIVDTVTTYGAYEQPI
jgi:hypothetical protein